MPSSDWDYKHVKANLCLFCLVFTWVLGTNSLSGAYPSLPSLSFFILNYTYASACVCVCVHVSAGAWRIKKRAARASDPLQLELHTLVSCLMWVPGPELESFVRTVLASNRWAACPAPTMLSKKRQFSQVKHLSFYVVSELSSARCFEGKVIGFWSVFLRVYITPGTSWQVYFK